MSVLEGAAFGTPSLAVDAPGIRDALIDGVTGRLVRPHHEADIPEALGAGDDGLPRDEAQREAYGAAARSQGSRPELEPLHRPMGGGIRRCRLEPARTTTPLGERRLSRSRTQGRKPMTQTVPERDWADASGGRVNAVLAPTRMHVANAIKTVAYRTGLHRTLFYRYDYMFRPRDLALLTTLLTETSGIEGPIFEIGCAAGHTTVFLNKHLDDLEDTRQYKCLDTFAGFTQADIDVEVERGHPTSQYEYVFRAYRKEWFDQTMENNHVSRVTSIQADVNTFDFSPYRNISFCLIDVDLTTARPVPSPRSTPAWRRAA